MLATWKQQHKISQLLFSVCRPAVAVEGCKQSVDRADAQQTSDAGGHIQSVSTLQ